jgi:hydrogenase maturation protease
VARVLLVGYGNTLRGDDALGPMAVERLRPQLPDTDCLSCHQLSPELAQRLAGYDLAVFVDAAAGGEPGSACVQRLSPETAKTASLTHHVQPATLLLMARTLYDRSPEAFLVTGAGADFANHEGLSQHGRKAMDEICRLVPLLILERT